MMEYLGFAACFVGLTVVSLWFALGYLTPFITACMAIVMCGVMVTLKFIFTPLIKPYTVITKTLAIIRARIPTIVKILGMIVLGVVILLLDHFYATKIFDMDQTEFYSITLWGTKYWMTNTALYISGGLIIIGIMFLFAYVYDWLGEVLDKRIDISFIVLK